MIKKLFQFFSFFVFLSIFIYLLLPSPSEPPPLPDSFRSTEPGDTVEIPGLFAYYTNMSRGDVVAYYQRYFSQSSFFGVPLLTYRLNHPPEYTWVVIRDTVHSSFLEELVHPFRESWYINGYEPANDPFNKTGQKLGDFRFNDKQYSTKVMVLREESSPILRSVIFIMAISFLGGLLLLIKRTYEDIRYNR